MKSGKQRLRLDPRIDRNFDNELGKALELSEKLQEGAVSILALVRLIEGRAGLLGLIASAYKDKLRSQIFAEQIKELSEKQYIPDKVRIDLDYLRKHSNLSRHSNITLIDYSVEEVQLIREHILSMLAWFYCECKEGPQYPSLMLPSTIVTAQVGHRRTVLGLVSIDDRGHDHIKKIKVLESHEFFHQRGFALFRCALSIFTNGSNPQGYALSLSCPVDRDGRRLAADDWNYWPSDVVSALDVRSDAIVMNDAVAFGFVADNIPNNERALILTLGSGIGCAVARRENGVLFIKPIELGADQFELDGITGTSSNVIGWKYFEDIQNDSSYDCGKITLTYTRRVAGVINILKTKLLFDSVIIGGGRSAYLSPETLKREFNLMNLPIAIHTEEETLVQAMACAWKYKYERHHNYYDSL